MASDPPDASTRCWASVIPCFSTSWATAASATATRSTARLARLMVGPFLGESSLAACASTASCRGAIADGILSRSRSQMIRVDGLLGVRRQAKHVLIAEQRGPKPDEQLVDASDGRPSLATPGDRAQRQA